MPRSETSASRHLAGRFVYMVGSHTFCGCGFDRNQANPDHPSELRDTETSLDALATYVGSAVALGTVELLTCWNGDEGKEPEHRLSLTPGCFSRSMEWFPERTLATISAAGR